MQYMKYQRVFAKSEATSKDKWGKVLILQKISDVSNQILTKLVLHRVCMKISQPQNLFKKKTLKSYSD